MVEAALEQHAPIDRNEADGATVRRGALHDLARRQGEGGKNAVLRRALGAVPTLSEKNEGRLGRRDRRPRLTVLLTWISVRRGVLELSSVAMRGRADVPSGSVEAPNRAEKIGSGKKVLRRVAMPDGESIGFHAASIILDS